MGKFEAVTKRSARREKRAPQAQRAKLYAQVNVNSGSHFTEQNITNPFTRPAKNKTSPGLSPALLRFIEGTRRYVNGSCSPRPIFPYPPNLSSAIFYASALPPTHVHRAALA